MPDREKVTKDLEECLSASCRGFRPRILCPYNDDEWDIMRDALTLLKDQDIVRCMECKHNTNTIHNPVCELDAYRSGGTDWFCADGERSESD